MTMPRRNASPFLGLHTHRFKENPEEMKFARAWAKNNEDGKTLAYLLDKNNGSGGRLETPSVRDQIVAATVIQWLGSPVGQCFLEDLGYNKAGIAALMVLKYLDEEGDSNGRCHICRSSPCDKTCRLSAALKAGGLK